MSEHVTRLFLMTHTAMALADKLAGTDEERKPSDFLTGAYPHFIEAEDDPPIRPADPRIQRAIDYGWLEVVEVRPNIPGERPFQTGELRMRWTSEGISYVEHTYLKALNAYPSCD